MFQELAGKTAIITGAGRGLGRAYACKLASMGANVVVSDIDLSSYKDFDAELALAGSKSTVDEITEMGGTALGVEADVTDRLAVQSIARTALDSFGSIDILVCNAGGGIGGPDGGIASELDADELKLVMDRNLAGTINSVVAVAPEMKRQRRGKIITVSSVAGIRPMPNGAYCHYGLAKAAVVMYTRYLAQDLGRFRITANCLAPGRIGTGRLMESFEKMGIEKVVSDIPLGRLGTTDECAATIGYLASTASDFMNGAVLTVDGGQSGL